MPDATFEVEGLPELVAKMEGLSYDLKRKGGRFALRRAAQVIRDAAKEGASRLDDPETAKDTSKNIVERWSGRHFKKTGDLMFRVGVMGGAGGSKKGSALSGLPGGDTRSWRHLELGTENTPAQPFMRPALSENLEAASNVFVKEYGKSIDRALRRAAKSKG